MLSSRTAVVAHLFATGPKFIICSVEILSSLVAFPDFSEGIPFPSSSIVMGRVWPGSSLYFVRLSLVLFLTFPLLPSSSSWLATWLAVTFGYCGGAFGSPRSLRMVD